MSRLNPQFTAFLCGGGSVVALTTWAYAQLPTWAAAFITIGCFLIGATVCLAVLIAFAAVVLVGLSSQCPERRKTSTVFFRLLLRLVGR